MKICDFMTQKPKRQCVTSILKNPVFGTNEKKQACPATFSSLWYQNPHKKHNLSSTRPKNQKKFRF